MPRGVKRCFILGCSEPDQADRPPHRDALSLTTMARVGGERLAGRQTGMTRLAREPLRRLIAELLVTRLPLDGSSTVDIVDAGQRKRLSGLLHENSLEGGRCVPDRGRAQR